MGFKGKERAFEHSAGQYDEKYVSYLNGYNQAIQDSKAREMLEMLTHCHSLMQDASKYYKSRTLNRAIKDVEQLINSSTKL